MEQNKIIKYYEENGGLRCKHWSLKEIQEHVKYDLGMNATIKTAKELKRTAEIYQR